MSQHQLFDIVTQILAVLFEREEANFIKLEQDLVTRHSQLGGSKDGFRHMGQVYTHLTGSSRRQGTYDRLSPELTGEMDSIRTTRKQVEMEKNLIRQALVLVLKGVSAPQDIRDALPNCLKDLIPAIARLPRTREEAYTLLDNPRALSQYMRIRDRIEFYVASRLLY